MKEFIEKLIGRLSNEYLKYNNFLQLDWNSAIDRSIKIVNELAEEHKPIINYNTLLNDIKSQLKQFITDSNNIDYNRALVEALEVIDKKAEEHKGGWIPCSERLPEVNQEVLVFDVISGMSIERLEEDEEFIWTVIAWQPLPEPYKEP